MVIPDLIPSADLNELQSALASLIELKGYGDRPHEKFGDQLPLDHVLHSGMIQATNNPTKDSKFIYNAIDMTPANMRLLMGEKILEAASILVGAEHRHHVLLNNMNVRIDIPTGKQLIGWHQDYHYLFHDTEPNKTVSAWIPLETCEKENGALEVAVGSHKRGLLKTKSVDKKDSNRDDYLVESDLPPCVRIVVASVFGKIE